MERETTIGGLSPSLRKILVLLETRQDVMQVAAPKLAKVSLCVVAFAEVFGFVTRFWSGLAGTESKEPKGGNQGIRSQKSNRRTV